MSQEQLRVYRRRKSKNAVSTGIEDLPDETLQHVLSFLPAREAVQTCVLARRWRHLWRSMPALHIVPEPRWERLSEQEFRTVNTFVNNLLAHRDRNAPLDMCEFLVNPFENLDQGPESSQLSNRLVTQHLTTLELKFVGLKSDFLDFSSCPALKNLSMMSCGIWAEKISSQSLKQLTMSHCYFYRRIRTRISTPSLVWLELSNNHRKTPLLESMPLLVRALVRLRDCNDRCGKEKFGGSCSNSSCVNCGDNGDRAGASVFLEGLSKAESLELVAGSAMFIFKRDLIWCPTFSKLKTLLLNEWCVAVDFYGIVCFLQHTPILEKLTLQLAKAPKNWVEMKRSYNPSKQPFASKKLKVVEVKCEAFDKRVHKLFKILSSNGICIEQINIQRTERCSECVTASRQMLI
ncbi:hypothetical protein ACP70R_003842 [Stipagrostis hirtigluma subsp. patula]